jgi:hypothetical protein
MRELYGRELYWMEECCTILENEAMEYQNKFIFASFANKVHIFHHYKFYTSRVVYIDVE